MGFVLLLVGWIGLGKLEIWMLATDGLPPLDLVANAMSDEV